MSMMEEIDRAMEILDYVAHGNISPEDKMQICGAGLHLERAQKSFNPEKEFWIEQLKARGIELDDEHLEKVLKLLGVWTNDAWDMMSDAIWSALQACGIVEEE